jgi:hypothetical protein
VLPSREAPYRARQAADTIGPLVAVAFDEAKSHEPADDAVDSLLPLAFGFPIEASPSLDFLQGLVAVLRGLDDAP